MILGCRTIYRFAGADSIRAVGIRYGIVVVGDRGQPPAVLPGKTKPANILWQALLKIVF